MSKYFERLWKGRIIGDEYDSRRSPGIPATLSKYGFGCLDPEPLDEEVVGQVRAWLADAPKIEPRRGYHSYGLKHVAERLLGRYVASGELIAACIQAGFAVKQERGRPERGPSPNAMIGISRAWVSKQITKHRNRARTRNTAGSYRP